MQAPYGGAVAVGKHAGVSRGAGPICAHPTLDGAAAGREIEVRDRAELDVAGAIEQQALAWAAADALAPVGCPS